MASSSGNLNMAVFCDFENVALGVRDAKYEKFDMQLVLERLLLKGSIVVKKAYCDWERYKGFKTAMHEANFELIEIPHARQSGKNSADIRLVVDALDLCYTKSHVDAFVIVSGDSDFSPLVSKLRENAKQVIGVGVKQSTSDLLIGNCDEFIFYDDLAREQMRQAAKRQAQQSAQSQGSSNGGGQGAPAGGKRDDERRRKEDVDARRSQAIEIAVGTFDALASERGDTGKIWASVLKEAIKRRKPDFNESYYGFRAFGNLLDEAQARGLLSVGRDEKSGTFVYKESGTPAAALADVAMPIAREPMAAAAVTTESVAAASGSPGKSRRGGRGRKKPAAEAGFDDTVPPQSPEPGAPPPAQPMIAVPAAAEADGSGSGASASPAAPATSEQRPATRSRRPAAKADQSAEASAPASQAAPADAGEPAAGKAPAKRARKRSNQNAAADSGQDGSARVADTPAQAPGRDVETGETAASKPAARKSASRGRRTRTQGDDAG